MTRDIEPGEDEDLVVLDVCTPSDRDFLSEQINDFNFATTGIFDGRELAVLVRSGDGTIVAGIYGWTWGGFCEVATLWVHETMRGRGLGTRLLGRVEDEARVRGARQVGLSTHSFQAPEFYRALGYTVTGRRDEYPEGHSQLWLTKTL